MVLRRSKCTQTRARFMMEEWGGGDMEKGVKQGEVEKVILGKI